MPGHFAEIGINPHSGQLIVTRGVPTRDDFLSLVVVDFPITTIRPHIIGTVNIVIDGNIQIFPFAKLQSDFLMFSVYTGINYFSKNWLFPNVPMS
jgi:hypothetical protein